MTIRSLRNPGYWVYLLSHLVLAMLGYMLLQSKDVLWQGVGASLVAAGITGYVIFVYVWLARRAV